MRGADEVVDDLHVNASGADAEFLPATEAVIFVFQLRTWNRLQYAGGLRGDRIRRETGGSEAPLGDLIPLESQSGLGHISGDDSSAL